MLRDKSNEIKIWIRGKDMILSIKNGDLYMLIKLKLKDIF